MTIDDVIRDFADADGTLPRAAMQWALDNWEVAGPRFIELVDRYPREIDRSTAMEDALFFAIHLLGEKRETRAFGALCRLLHEGEASEVILGDAITESLRDILISTYDGNAEPLKQVIESTTAEEFARASALEAMGYITRIGLIADDEMRAYLMHLRSDMRPRGESFIWTAWALTAANLGYGDYAGEVETLLGRGFISSMDIGIDDFHAQLRRATEDPKGLAGFEHDHVRPFTDTIGTLSSWYGFSEQRKRDEVRRALREEMEAWPPTGGPHLNPLRRVGRNDPCPCGSGRKYKKCCLQ